MRTSATLMSNALAFAEATDPIGAKRHARLRREDFTRALMAQSASSAGTPRAALVGELDTAFQDFSSRCDRALGGRRLSLGEIQANETALYRVLNAIDKLTASDYAASREAEAGPSSSLGRPSGSSRSSSGRPSPSRRPVVARGCRRS
jgi:hypothetical protein